MGFLKRLFGINTTDVPTSLLEPRRSNPENRTPTPKASLPGPGTFSVCVVGEMQYQSNLEQICGPRNEHGENREEEAQLVHENANPYDPMAIRVDIRALTVGYLSRENARQYRQQLASAGHPGIDAWCKARIRGGWNRGPRDQGLYGVVLDLPVNE